eukprot:CAMPEP_0175223600 /NCGR_PEP_ID=MMETSP0093-20121207/21416_1 /TAXON_ID=311494 /ORGANISM="Alexandrium monilatum, Strain CCMP3105" /LENGTH=216 /DNA_ID=CAMNT_0016517209 /DNA_START=51 /DNA_END=701 /DNA_ORIENTATION=+
MPSAALCILSAALVSRAVAGEFPDEVEAMVEAECEAASLSLLQGGKKVLDVAALQPNASELLEPNHTVLAADLTAVRSLAEVVGSQLEYELTMSAETVGKKNKVVLAMVELLGLGLFGIDRCYMGQTCLGVAKGLTFGGLTVWALLDYVGVIVTCLAMHPSIHFLGMRANFTQGSITAAFVIVIVLLVLKCCSSLWARRLRGNAPSRASAGRSEAK